MKDSSFSENCSINTRPFYLFVSVLYLVDNILSTGLTEANYFLLELLISPESRYGQVQSCFCPDGLRQGEYRFQG